VSQARSQAESQPAGESKSSEQNLPVGLEDEDHMLQQVNLRGHFNENRGLT
jgi:hypothetical protein